MIYKSNRPYPDVQVEGENLTYASILLNAYAGSVSEDTSIHLYLYQSFVSDSQVEYHDVIMKIAEVEMTHFRLLGEAILKLGMPPIFGSFSDDGFLRLWDSGNVSYQMSLQKMLEIDIEAESEAIRHYKEALVLIKDIYVQRLIERILEDEEIHLSIFKQMYEKYFH